MDEFYRKATLDRVIDGDTVDLIIDLGWGLTLNERCRLLNIDTPEIRGIEKQLGLEYKDFVTYWFQTQPFVWIHSKDYKKGKYGRTLVDIFSFDQRNCLNELLKEKLNGS